jgi:PilZ domain
MFTRLCHHWRMRQTDLPGSELRGRRTPVIAKGVLKLGLFRSVPCEIRNISSGGVRFVTRKELDLPETFQIRLPTSRRPRLCQRRWQLGRETGVEFI